MFKDMSDWCMFKDYNGAEPFNDGSRPLMGETQFADIVISGNPHKNNVIIGVYPYNEVFEYHYEGFVTTKESAEPIGIEIANYINSNSDGQFMFTNGSFMEFFKGLQITDIRSGYLDIRENTPSAPPLYEDEAEQGEEI
jgi:hypothetical protein